MKISIITVVLNSVSTINDTINSVLEQEYTNFEHIIIDGISVDGTQEKVKSLLHDKLIFKSEMDVGIYDAMNKGISIATGDLIGFLNSDDYYFDRNVLTRIAEAFKDKSVDACFGDLIYVDRINNKKIVRNWKSRPFRIGDFSRGWSPAHPTFYVRKSVIERFGVFNLNYKLASDVELMARFLEINQINSIYIPFAQVVMRLGGVTNVSLKNRILQNMEILKSFRSLSIKYSILLFFIFKIIERLKQRIN